MTVSVSQSRKDLCAEISRLDREDRSLDNFNEALVVTFTACTHYRNTMLHVYDFLRTQALLNMHLGPKLMRAWAKEISEFARDLLGHNLLRSYNCLPYQSAQLLSDICRRLILYTDEVKFGLDTWGMYECAHKIIHLRECVAHIRELMELLELITGFSDKDLSSRALNRTRKIILNYNMGCHLKIDYLTVQELRDAVNEQMTWGINYSSTWHEETIIDANMTMHPSSLPNIKHVLP